MSNVISGNNEPRKFCRFTGYSSNEVNKLIMIVRLWTVDRMKLISPSRKGLKTYVIASEASDMVVIASVFKTIAFLAS
jgi:hypothetical protein